MLFVVVFINRYKVTTKSKQFPILLGKTGIRLLAYSHPVVITVISILGLIFLALNEKPFREGHDFIDNYMETNAH